MSDAGSGGKRSVPGWSEKWMRMGGVREGQREETRRRQAKGTREERTGLAPKAESLCLHLRGREWLIRREFSMMSDER